MAVEQKEKYGIYIPELQTFMYIDATREQFEEMLGSLNLGEKQLAAFEQSPNRDLSLRTVQFSDFDYVVSEVNAAPYDSFC